MSAARMPDGDKTMRDGVPALLSRLGREGISTRSDRILVRHRAAIELVEQMDDTHDYSQRQEAM
jgi:hypothetical protein